MRADYDHDMAVPCDKLYMGGALTGWHVKGSPSQQEILQRSWQRLTTQKGKMQEKSQWKGNRRVMGTLWVRAPKGSSGLKSYGFQVIVISSMPSYCYLCPAGLGYSFSEYAKKAGSNW